jgi:hypothetical protein
MEVGVKKRVRAELRATMAIFTRQLARGCKVEDLVVHQVPGTVG